MSFLAIDIGGTNIKVGIVSESGSVTESFEKPTPMESFEALCQVLGQIIDWGMGYSIKGIGISQPCSTDPKTGECMSEGALGYILHRNIKDFAAKYSGLPVAVDNDGNCAAAAELWIGGATELQNFAFVVCGTGIGGAVIKNRSIQYGSRLFAGEFGMMINQYDVETGKYKIWSDNGATISVVQDYARRTGQPEKSLNGKMVFDLAEDGDPVASACVHAFYTHFAVGLHNIQHVYDPERILIGGAVSQRADLIPRIDAILDNIYNELSIGCSRPSIAVTPLGPDANLIGAVYPFMKN